MKTTVPSGLLTLQVRLYQTSLTMFNLQFNCLVDHCYHICEKHVQYTKQAAKCPFTITSFRDLYCRSLFCICVYDVSLQQSPDRAHLSTVRVTFTFLYMRRSKLCQDRTCTDLLGLFLPHLLMLDLKFGFIKLES